MKLGWQSILGPVFWIAVTYLGLTYGPGWIAKLQGKPEVESGTAQIRRNLSQSILGQEGVAGIIPQKLPATPQEVPQFVKEIIERITNTVIEKGQSQVEEKKTEVVKNTCGQVIAEIEKQCNITTSNQ